ncbi:MAG: ABC transporter transmembrane domain-containing protein, partial [Solirubrobacterales bacterium]|nr:ABC transporter transmembrane domain-containing protein [Solirubrobacterales bacterium]
MARAEGKRAESEPVVSRGANIRALLGLVRPYRVRVAAMLVALLVGTGATLTPPLLAKVAIDQGIGHRDTTTLVLTVVAFLASAVLAWVMTYAQTYLVGWVGQRALADLRLRIFTHLQSLPVDFYESRPAGVLISRMTNDVEALDSLVTDSVVTLFQSGLTLLGTIVILVVLDVRLALITFTIFPLLAAGSLWFRIASTGAFRRTRETIGSITAYLQETLSGIRVVRTFGQERRHEAQFAELNEENRAANWTTVKLNASYFPTVEMLSGIAVAGIVLYGGYQAIDGHITAGTVVAFVAALSNLFDPIQQLSQLYTTYQSGMAALEKIFQLLGVRAELRDREGARELPPIRGEVDFEDVSFAYGRRGSGGARRSDRARQPDGARRRADDARQPDGAQRADGARQPDGARRRADDARQPDGAQRADDARQPAEAPRPAEARQPGELALEHVTLHIPPGQTV